MKVNTLDFVCLWSDSAQIHLEKMANGYRVTKYFSSRGNPRGYSYTYRIVKEAHSVAELSKHIKNALKEINEHKKYSGALPQGMNAFVN